MSSIVNWFDESVEEFNGTIAWEDEDITEFVVPAAGNRDEGFSWPRWKWSTAEENDILITANFDENSRNCNKTLLRFNVANPKMLKTTGFGLFLFAAAAAAVLAADGKMWSNTTKDVIYSVGRPKTEYPIV